jgi:hypothetical protein
VKLRCLIAFLPCVAFSCVVYGQQLRGHQIYNTAYNGQPTAPLTPSSKLAEQLIKQFSAADLPYFAKANDLSVYLPLGDRKYLLETSSQLPAANGIFLVDLRRGDVKGLVIGDHDLVGPKIYGNLQWYLTKSVGGRNGVGGETLSAIVIEKKPGGTVAVSTKELASVLWDMVSGLCGDTLTEGAGGDIESYEIEENEKVPTVRVLLTEQDCKTKVTKHHLRRFVLRRNSFELAP